VSDEDLPDTWSLDGPEVNGSGQVNRRTWRVSRDEVGVFDIELTCGTETRKVKVHIGPLVVHVHDVKVVELDDTVSLKVDVKPALPSNETVKLHLTRMSAGEAAFLEGATEKMEVTLTGDTNAVLLKGKEVSSSPGDMRIHASTDASGSPEEIQGSESLFTVATIKIHYHGEEVDSQTTYATCVGRQVLLEAVPEPYGLQWGERSPAWSLVGHYVADYAASVESAKLMMLTDADKKKREISYYWVKPYVGTATVVFSGKFDERGSTFTENVKFNVVGPTVTNSSANYGVEPRVDRDYQPLPGMWAYHLGGSQAGPVGASFSVAVNQPTGFSGHSFFTQTVKLKRYWMRSATHPTKPSTWRCMSGDGLDGSYPYFSGSSTNDNPAGGIFSSDGSSAHVAADEFEMWAMWECDDANVETIPIPLRKFPWKWYVRAERVGEGEDDSWARVGSFWPTAAGPIQHADIGSLDFPEWSNRIVVGGGGEPSGIDFYDVFEPPASP